MVNVAPSRPRCVFSLVTIMTGKKPIGPIIDQLREATLGAEMVDLSLAYLLTVAQRP